jgi:hypothetical protein
MVRTLLAFQHSALIAKRTSKASVVNQYPSCTTPDKTSTGGVRSRSERKTRSRLVDYPGLFDMHCHILAH